MKKEITAKKAIKSMAILSLAATLGLATSCKTEGCTDNTASNYNADADKDDGSCTYTSGNTVVTGEITANTTWTAGNVYELNGRVTVVDGVTLTIEPGTVVKGGSGLGSSASVLLIARGGKLMANGTATMPIIFTSVSDQITPAQVASGNYISPNLLPTNAGLWGGLVVCGKAQISVANGTEEQVEGIPASDLNGLYGGSDNMDNSGSISYVSIRHSGIDLASGNEIQGLTLAGVGSATVVNNIEVLGNNDDGIEFFGGTVDVDNVVIWNVGDDGLDTDKGYSGDVTDFFLIGSFGGSPFELDGPEGTPLTTGNHSFSNGIVKASTIVDHLLDVDGGTKTTNVDISNVYFTNIVNENNRVADYATWNTTTTGAFTNFEYTFTDSTVNVIREDTVFMDMPNSITTSVANGANTVGPAVSQFSWTWAGQAGEL